MAKTKDVTIQDLMEPHEQAIALYSRYIAKLTGLPGTGQAIGNFRHIIAAAQRSIAILRSAR